MASFDKKWEKNIYRKGGQLNNYPYDLVVSIFARKFFKLPPAKRSKLKILDLGCGGGNHSKFFAENGFKVYGLDGSESAVAHCRTKFKKNKLAGDFRVGDFADLPYPNNFFDAALDRESLYANRPENIKIAVEEVYEKLKPGGLFVSFMFNQFHPDKTKGRKIGPNTYDDFKAGSSFYRSGVSHFLTMPEIEKLFAKFKILSIRRHSLYEVYDKTSSEGQTDEYIIIAEK